VQYYNWILTSNIPAAELRLFGLGPYFKVAHRELRQRLRRERLKLIIQENVAQLGAGLFALLITGSALCWVGWNAVKGHATLGDLALFYQAFNKGQSLLRSLLQNIGQIYSNTLFLSNLFQFLDLQPQISDSPSARPVPQQLQEGLRLERLSFTYPESERPVLKDFSLFIPAGKIVALVGENGAGKSTLIKLICRLYDPTGGCICLDGIDLRQLSLIELRQRITVLFQEPFRYYGTVSENIALGDISALPEKERLVAAAHAADVHGIIDRLPEGYATLLGKWFKNATDLSVGEWQRLSLARAFLRQAPLMLLDEPTSAMDSWAETSWMERFRQLAEGRTTLIITHRFTTAMCADTIYVMHQGQIVESGSHEALITQNGRYANSWKKQMHEHAPCG
jgi:ATP-binding cassette subfamily B protein